MRLLFLLQGYEVEDQPGYDDGFKRLLAEGILKSYQVIPYCGFIKHYGAEAFYSYVLDIAKNMETEALFLQFPHGLKASPAGFLDNIRNLPNKPTIFTSNGDGFMPLLKRTPRSLLEAAKHSDLTFTTTMGRLARQFERHGARNIVLMPHGYCQVRFGKNEPPQVNKTEFDIVFIGSLNKSLNPFKYYHKANRRRKEMVDILSERYGVRFGLFGHGWQGNKSWQGPISFNDQEPTYQRARVAFGGYPGATTDYYNSDRPFISAVSGVPLVDYNVLRVDRFLKNGEHWFLYNDKNEMITILEHLLSQGNGYLRKIGADARELCRNRHSQYHRARAMVEIVTQVRNARLAGVKAPLPKLDFFHDQVKLDDEYPYAVCNWC